VQLFSSEELIWKASDDFVKKIPTNNLANSEQRNSDTVRTHYAVALYELPWTNNGATKTPSHLWVVTMLNCCMEHNVHHDDHTIFDSEGAAERKLINGLQSDLLTEAIRHATEFGTEYDFLQKTYADDAKSFAVKIQGELDRLRRLRCTKTKQHVCGSQWGIAKVPVVYH